eukprot:684243-Alexandrium_andersonii.AAC.1
MALSGGARTANSASGENGSPCGRPSTSLTPSAATAPPKAGHLYCALQAASRASRTFWSSCQCLSMSSASAQAVFSNALAVSM